MTKISCKISDLEEICKLASLKGRDRSGKEYTAIPDFLMSADRDYLEVRAVDNKDAIALRLSYKIMTEESGLIPVGDVALFQKYLSRFNSSDKVSLKTTQNKIIISRESPKKTAYIPKDSVDTLTTSKNAEVVLGKFEKNPEGYPKTSKTVLGLKLVLKSEDVKTVIDDGEVVKQRIYPWTVVDGVLSIKVGSEQLGEIESTIIPVESSVSGIEGIDTKTRYAYGLDNIFNNISGKVTVFLNNTDKNCPMYLEKETDAYHLTILLAPASVGQ